MTPNSKTNNGHEAGFADACDWIADLRADEYNGSIAEQIEDALKPGQLGADEALINALTTTELEQQVGAPVRNTDGTWTDYAEQWLRDYSKGWRSALEDRLAKAALTVGTTA